MRENMTSLNGLLLNTAASTQFSQTLIPVIADKKEIFEKHGSWHRISAIVYVPDLAMCIIDSKRMKLHPLDPMMFNPFPASVLF